MIWKKDLQTTLFWGCIAVLLSTSLFYGFNANRMRLSMHGSEGKINSGDVVALERIINGDSVIVAQEGQKPATVRLLGIKAFETNIEKDIVAPYGQAAVDTLKRLIAGRSVRVLLHSTPKDRYGRYIAMLYVDDQDVGLRLRQRRIGSSLYGLSISGHVIIPSGAGAGQGGTTWPLGQYRSDDKGLGTYSRMAGAFTVMYYFIQYYLRSAFRNPPVPLRIFILLGAILIYGTTGFLYFELAENPDLSWSDGLWYTVVTMTTVGYGDFFPKTAGGRFLVGWPIMVFGIGLLGYALSVIAAALITSKSKEIKGMSAFELKDHLIIFNFSGLAKIERILDELFLDPAFASSTPIVLVDEYLEELPPELQKRNVHFVRGNPVRDQTLSRAAIDHALHAIILCRDPGDPASDNLNVTIALAIEGRHRKTITVVECVDHDSEELLRKAGCDRIVCTSRFGANFVSQEILNPGVQDVINDILSARDGQQIYFTEVPHEVSFAELVKICRKTNHLALGINSPAGIRLNIPEPTLVHKGDVLITIGSSRIPLLKAFKTSHG